MFSLPDSREMLKAARSGLKAGLLVVAFMSRDWWISERRGRRLKSRRMAPDAGIESSVLPIS